jgi:predicted MPP superfamily phosphohydrolase
VHESSEKELLHARIERPRRGPWLQLFSEAGFEWNRVRLPIPNLPTTFENLRILHLSDLHLRPRWRRPFDELLARIASSPPDLVLITGDLLEHKYDPSWSLESLERFLCGCRSRLGTFAILGNHDGDLIGPQVTRFGAHLTNGRYITLHDPPIELIGMPGINRTDVYGSKLLAQIPAKPDGALRIVMTHYPDTIHQAAPLQPDVVLTGHTHGGQVCLPGGIPIIKHDTLPRRIVCGGAFRRMETWLVVNRGFGFATWQVRMFCPGEVIEVTLTRP